MLDDLIVAKIATISYQVVVQMVVQNVLEYHPHQLVNFFALIVDYIHDYVSLEGNIEDLS